MQSDPEMKVQMMSRGEPLSSEALDSLQSRRREFLAKTIAAVMGLLGLVLIGVLLGNVVHALKDEATGLPPAQILQGVAGAVLFVLVLRGLIARWLSAFFADPRSRIKVFLFPLIVWPVFLLYRIQVDDLKSYLRRISEGSLVEWLGFLLLFSAAILLWKAARPQGSSMVKLLMRIGSVGLFLLSMEEMSWGQMIFNWGTPELMNEHNIQHETNLHNLSFLHAHTWTIAACVFTLLFGLAVAGFVLRRRGLLAFGSLADVLLPLGCTASYFAIAALMYWGVVMEKWGVDLVLLHTREQEIAEFLFSVGVFIHVAYLYLGHADSGLRQSVNPDGQV